MLQRVLSSIFITALIAITVEMANSQVVQYRGCSVDAELLRLPSCAFETRNGHLYISSRYLKLFFVESKEKLESRVMPDGDWAYFNRSGRIVVTNVAPFDNGASYFHFGLVRVVRDGKWGLADEHGTPIVPFVYDGMYEFDDTLHRWKACKGCSEERFGEYSRFKGGQWFWLDERGLSIGSPTP